jgi:hypothetical protein
MKLEDAVSTIERCAGFTDKTTATGEAFAIVLAALAERDQQIDALQEKLEFYRNNRTIQTIEALQATLAEKEREIKEWKAKDYLSGENEVGFLATDAAGTKVWVSSKSAVVEKLKELIATLTEQLAEKGRLLQEEREMSLWIQSECDKAVDVCEEQAKQIVDLTAENKKLVEMTDLLDEIIITLRHALMFINCKEKMHPTGVELHDDLIARLVRIKDSNSIKQDAIDNEQYVP